ncbi:hypothetical protein DFH29DRAFT_997408 [Suillus ampliporus]|nr:hypothetical protein DFH29DRAFT_997408 [Suillus ampliporus]
MSQSLCQTFKLQGHTSINLNLWIELVGNTDPRGEGSEVDDDDNCLLVGNNEVALCPVKSHKRGEAAHGTGDMESVAKLKEQLQLVELGCSRLAELYQKYRLHWLEEHYWAKVLEEYAPHGINTCSAHQIAWDTPSPIQSDDGNDEEVE